jgi:hypothetical protein
MAIEGSYFGECAASRARLSEVTGFSELAIREAQIALIAIGALELLERGGGRGHPAVYRLTGKKRKVNDIDNQSKGAT